jgi:hypothetical protein
MSNRIVQVELRDRSVIPAEAEVQATVVPQELGPTTQVRGQLVGPRCRYASTVEVAYPFRPLLVPTGRPALVVRAIIPEANTWSLESPHLYLGCLELIQDGVRCDQVAIRHGLRTMSLGPRGFRLNGRLLQWRGRRVETLEVAQALQLREAGYNLVLTEVSPQAANVWEVADSVGLLVLGRLPASKCDPQLLARLAWHPSCVGWLAGPDVELPDVLPPGTLLGTEGILRLPPGLSSSFTAVRPGASPEGKRPYVRLDADKEEVDSSDPRCLGSVEG